MPKENAKEMKCVVTFLSILSIIILGSFIIDRNISDIFYLAFLQICLIRYIIACRK
jgi:hypothetical protein